MTKSHPRVTPTEALRIIRAARDANVGAADPEYAFRGIRYEAFDDFAADVADAGLKGVYRRGKPIEPGEIEHESFGVIGVSRIDGSARMFLSNTDIAPSYMQLKVKRAKLTPDDYSGVTPWATEELITINMTAIQYAEMLTYTNRGGGVPCTIARFDGVRMETVPERPSPLDEMARTAARRMDEATRGAVAEAEQALNDELSRPGKNPRLSVLRKVRTKLTHARQRLDKDPAFWFSQMTEKAAALKSAAKAEVAGAFDMIIRDLGERELQRKLAPSNSSAKVIELLSGDGDD